MSLRLLICGSRHWSDVGFIARYMHGLPHDTTIIHGGCPTGVDAIAQVIADQRCLRTEAYPADWNTHGQAAGAMRNQQMFDHGKPSHVAVFSLNVWNSKNTRDVVTRALQSGLPVWYNPLFQQNPCAVIRMNTNGALFIGIG